MPSASRTIMSPALSIRSFPESVVYASPATATSTTSGIRSARRSCPEVRTKLSSSAVNMAATSAEVLSIDRPARTVLAWWTTGYLPPYPRKYCA